MRSEATALIESLVGGRVLGLVSDSHLGPDVAAELFVLDAFGEVDDGAGLPPERSATGSISPPHDCAR